MTSTRQARPASRWMGLIGAALVAAPGLAQAQVLDLLYERTVMTSADRRCDLFAPEISAALAAAQAQSRGAALRAGASADQLRALEWRARRAGVGSDCGSPALAGAAARVRDAFAGYARLQRINYPGELSTWRADRTGIGAIRWRLAQDSQAGRDHMTFGLAGRRSPGVVLAVARFHDQQTPYGARLLLRDETRSTGPYLDRVSRPGAGLSLERRLPPRAAVRTYAAEARSPAGADLLPKAGPGWAFRFPAPAAADLARLDPRESVAVEFLFPGDVARRFYVEVGDFAAGRAFLSLGAR